MGVGIHRLSESVSMERAHVLHKQGGGGHTGGKKYYPGVHMKLLWYVIYCTKPMPDIGTCSRSRFRGGLGRKYPRIMQEYDLATVIEIRPLIHPCT